MGLHPVLQELVQDNSVKCIKVNSKGEVRYAIGCEEYVHEQTVRYQDYIEFLIYFNADICSLFSDTPVLKNITEENYLIVTTDETQNKEGCYVTILYKQHQ